MENFTIASVASNVFNNHIAWARPLAHATTIEEARIVSNEIYNQEREAANNWGYDMDSIIIHDGKNILS